MQNVLLRIGILFFVGTLPSVAGAVTALEADPEHYRFEFENKCVKVMRAIFGPHEKTPAYFDADSDAVFVSLTASPGIKQIYSNGKSFTPQPFPAGLVTWVYGPGRIMQENTGDTRLEFIIIEPKGCN
jgi:hypothetical protein